MTQFVPGQRVRCDMAAPFPVLQKGATYTVAEADAGMVRLTELLNQHFQAARFVPIPSAIPRSTMAIPPPPPPVPPQTRDAALRDTFAAIRAELDRLEAAMGVGR